MEQAKSEHVQELKCKHGNHFYCGLCAEEQAPKCEHGKAFYCGICGGPVKAEARQRRNDTGLRMLL